MNHKRERKQNKAENRNIVRISDNDWSTPVQAALSEVKFASQKPKKFINSEGIKLININRYIQNRSKYSK